MTPWNRLYQIDMIPSIWGHVEAMLAEGKAVVTIQVYEEIKKVDDALFGWCKERKELFTAIDDAHIERLRGILGSRQPVAAETLPIHGLCHSLSALIRRAAS